MDPTITAAWISGGVGAVGIVFRYQVTGAGLRQALFLTHLVHHMLIPGLVQLAGPDPPAPSRLRTAARAYETALDDLAR